MKTKLAALALLALATAAVFASGMPWYKWMNTMDRTLLCSQTSPGKTWIQYQGPFMESKCRKPGNPQ